MWACQFETRDAKTGEVLRYNADDDSTSLGDMLRQEKFGGGSSDQKNLDAEFARQIMTDGGFKVCILLIAYNWSSRVPTCSTIERPRLHGR